MTYMTCRFANYLSEYDLTRGQLEVLFRKRLSLQLKVMQKLLQLNRIFRPTF